MTHLTNDILWAEFLPNDESEISNLRASVVAFFAMGPQRQAKDIGSGFVIWGNGEAALVMTARHVLDHARDVQTPSRSAPSSLFAPERQLKLGAAGIFSAIWFNSAGKPVILDVQSVRYNDGTDAAICIVTPHTKDVAFDPVSIALHPVEPSLGEEVSVLSCAISPLKETAPPMNYDGTGQALAFENRITMRMGTVTAVYSKSYRQFGWPCFTASMPVDPGMSGGLAFISKPGQTYAACGVISADCSDDNARSDNSIAGEAVLASVWPSLGLKAPIATSEHRGENSLFHLLKHGVLPAPLGGIAHIELEEHPNGDYSIGNTA